jgi:hypothetical protein
MWETLCTTGVYVFGSGVRISSRSEQTRHRVVVEGVQGQEKGPVVAACCRLSDRNCSPVARWRPLARDWRMSKARVGSETMRVAGANAAGKGPTEQNGNCQRLAPMLALNTAKVRVETFALSRFRQIESTGQTFTRPDGLSPETYARAAFGIVGGEDPIIDWRSAVREGEAPAEPRQQGEHE